MSESGGHSYLQSHEIGGDTLLLDLEAESKKVLEEAQNAGVRRAARTLVKEGPLRVVIIGMKAGSSIDEHDAGGPVSLHALTGEVTVESGDRRDELKPGNSLVFPAAVSHSLRAQSDAVVLVTIAWPAA